MNSDPDASITYSTDSSSPLASKGSVRLCSKILLDGLSEDVGPVHELLRSEERGKVDGGGEAGGRRRRRAVGGGAS